MPRRTKHSVCPRCGSSDVVRIVYGLTADPSREGYEKAHREGIRFGGCCLEPDSPTRQCADCDHSWGGLFREPAEPGAKNPAFDP